jgi:predicted transcriptional regulator
LIHKESFKLGESLLGQISKEAEKRDRSKGYVMRQAIEEFFERQAKAAKRRAAK